MPMRCAVRGGELCHALVPDLGGFTADLIWQPHAGERPKHGRFQDEVGSRPPCEIFAVDRSFGVPHRLIVDSASARRRTADASCIATSRGGQRPAS
jgi:hypothetical protein